MTEGVVTESIAKDISRNICHQCRADCVVRHEPILTEIKNLKGNSDKQDKKLDAIRNLTYTLIGGTVVGLILQLVNLSSRK